MPSLCACHSGKNYQDCCQPYHQGTAAPNALALMRARYSAYALQQNQYIINTTHPKNPSYETDHELWKKEIARHYKETKFLNLSILEFIDGPQEAFVTFCAQLQKGTQNRSFTEKSRFEKVNGEWLYLDGVLQPH